MKICFTGGNFMIDKSSAIPVYYQLKEEIKEKISQGVWTKGECIDSERELSENYGVSRMTVRQALGELVQEGILIREKGKGTFVCEKKVKQQDMMSFSEIVKNAGKDLETVVLEFEVIDILDSLKGIFKENKLYKINRLRIVDKEIVANEIVYIPVNYINGIKEEELKYSLHKILENKGYLVERAESSIVAVIMDKDLKSLFKLDKDVPLLKSNSTVYDIDNKVLYVEDAIYRSDKYILEVNISRRNIIFC